MLIVDFLSFLYGGNGPEQGQRIDDANRARIWQYWLLVTLTLH